MSSFTPDVPEIERTRSAYAAGPLGDEARWQVGEDLRALLEGFHPGDHGLKRKEREAKLVTIAAAVGNGATAAKLREVWRLAVLLDGNRVEGKTWDDHWRAIHRSAPGRGKHDLEVALELLSGNEEAMSNFDPVATIDGLSEAQRAAVRRVLRNRKDLDDDVVVKAVVQLLRGSAKKAAKSVASAEQEHIRAMRRRRADEAAEMEAKNPNSKVLAKYHDEVMELIDRLYSIKGVVEQLPEGAWRKWARGLLEGSLLSAINAAEALLDTLEEPCGDDGPLVEAHDTTCAVVEPRSAITAA